MNKINLVVCITPLQILIARKLTKIFPDQIFYSLCIYYDDNKKYKYYIDLIKGDVSHASSYYAKSNNKIMRFFDLLAFSQFLNKNKFPDFSNVYIASVDNPFVQLLISSIIFKNIYTFDDGTANLWKNSIYNVPLDKGFVQKILLKLLGVKYDIHALKEISKAHYTLFEDTIFLRDKNVKIDLYDFKDDKYVVDESKNIKIFLGQPFNDLKYDVFNEGDIKKVLNTLNVKNYFPHPRERVVYNFIDYIDSSKIFEDYIFDLLAAHYSIEVYTFLSTAALTVANIEKLKVYALYNDELYQDFFELYEIFRKNNIGLIKV